MAEQCPPPTPFSFRTTHKQPGPVSVVRELCLDFQARVTISVQAEDLRKNAFKDRLECVVSFQGGQENVQLHKSLNACKVVKN